MIGRSNRFARPSPARRSAKVARAAHAAHTAHGAHGACATPPRPARAAWPARRRGSLVLASAIAALALGSLALAGSIAVRLDAGPSWSRGGFDVAAFSCTVADAGAVSDAGAGARTCPALPPLGVGASSRPGTQWPTP